MIYTHEQMKNKFGVVFIVNALKGNQVEEHYKTDYLPFDTYGSVEEAKAGFIDKVKSKYECEKEAEEPLLSSYKKSPVFLRFLSIFFGSTNKYKDYVVAKAKVEKAKENLNAAINKIENGEVVYLDESMTYKIEYPDIKIGTNIYLVVLEANLLEEGFYPGEVYDIKYSLVNKNEVRFTGAFSVNVDGENQELQLNTDNDGKLRDGYMNHVVYLNKEEGEVRYQEKMKERLAFFEKKAKGE